MDIYNLFCDLFPLLLQGTLAGLIVLYFTNKIQKNKEKRLLKIYAVTVYLEIKNHLEIIDTFKQNPVVPRDISPYNFEKNYWYKAIPHLSDLPLENLSVIAEYYRRIWGFDSGIDTIHPHTLTDEQQRYINDLSILAHKSIDILSKHIKNPSCN